MLHSTWTDTIDRLIYVSMTNILLLSSLISLMSMSLEGVMLHAREEYLFQ